MGAGSSHHLTPHLEATGYVSASVDQILESTRAVKAPSAPMCQLLEVLHNPNHTSPDLAGLVKLDPELAASTLRIANSAALRTRAGSVASIDRAIVLMGESALVQLITARMMDSMRVEAVAGYETDGRRLWEASVCTAFAGDDCAGRSGVAPPSIAYTAGLLLDIGKIGLGPYLATRLDEVVEEARAAADGGRTFDEAEHAVLGIDHGAVGAYMAQTWGFPAALCAAIRHHHRPADATEHQALVYVSHLADRIAIMAGPGNAVDAFLYRLDEAWTTYVPLETADLESMAAEAHEATATMIKACART